MKIAKELGVRIIRVRGLWHVALDDEMMSEKGFFTRRRAARHYFDTQNRDGMPVVKYKRKEWNGKS